MTDFDYGLAGRRTAWPVASPAEMFWPDILSPVSHLEGDREFADSPLEERGFELPVPRAVEERCRNDKLRSRAMVRSLA